MTSFPSINQDLENAGACWRDAEVVPDPGTARNRRSDSIPHFNDAMIEDFEEGIRAGLRQADAVARP